MNFRDAINPYGSNFSAPIWYNGMGQCFMRTGHTVGPGPERSKGYFLLLRRMLDHRTTSATAWRNKSVSFSLLTRWAFLLKRPQL